MHVCVWVGLVLVWTCRGLNLAVHSQSEECVGTAVTRADKVVGSFSVYGGQESTDLDFKIIDPEGKELFEIERQGYFSFRFVALFEGNSFP